MGEHLAISDADVFELVRLPLRIQQKVIQSQDFAKGHLRSFKVKCRKTKFSNPFLGVSCVHGLSGFTSTWNLLFL